MLSIINDDQAYVPPTTKHKEKLLRENSNRQLLCKECRETERSVKSEANKYDERLSQKYGQRILRADLDPRGSIGQFNDQASSQKTASNRPNSPTMLPQDEEHERLLQK